MARQIAGQVIVLTGAGSGIGRETAVEFARRGADVVRQPPLQSRLAARHR